MAPIKKNRSNKKVFVTHHRKKKVKRPLFNEDRYNDNTLNTMLSNKKFLKADRK